MRTTLTLLATAAAAVLATAANAHDAGEQRFVHDGQTYVYTSATRGDLQVLDGHRFPSGSRFHLVVRGDQVTGTANGTPVTFRTTEAQGATGTETAAR